jgi:hypothetical protein
MPFKHNIPKISAHFKIVLLLGCYLTLQHFPQLHSFIFPLLLSIYSFMHILSLYIVVNYVIPSSCALMLFQQQVVNASLVFRWLGVGTGSVGFGANRHRNMSCFGGGLMFVLIDQNSCATKHELRNLPPFETYQVLANNLARVSMLDVTTLVLGS